MNDISSPSHAPRWVVALDLEPSGNGPVEFVRWFHETAGDRSPRFTALHVLEDQYLYPVLEYHKLAEVEHNAKKALLGDIDRAWASASFSGLDVIQGNRASHALNEVCSTTTAAALVLGRHAPREGRHLVRLGRVPRQVLREVSVPTIVVPPDFEAESGPAGPVIVATSMSEMCVDVATVGQGLAKALQRPLMLLHVREAPSRYAARYTPEASLAELERRLQADAEAKLMAWAAVHFGDRAECRVVSGSVSEALVETSAQLSASLLLMGAEYAPLLERVVSGNHVSHVAAHSAGPVMVVPPLNDEARQRWMA